jgi:hypothetical protein
MYGNEQETFTYWCKGNTQNSYYSSSLNIVYTASIRQFQLRHQTIMFDNACIIDVELLFESQTKKIIKEVCIYLVNSRQLQNYHVLPNIPQFCLTPKVISMNGYITSNIHKLDYDYGQIDGETIHEYMRLFTKTCTVFAKGYEKCQFIAGIIEKPVHNLEEFGCPKVKVLPPANDCSCLKHGTDFLHCCQIKCLRLGRWFYWKLNALSNLQYTYTGRQECLNILSKAKVYPPHVCNNGF